MQQLNLAFSAIRKGGDHTANPSRAVRVPSGFDQRQLAEFPRLSVPTIRRTEASEATARGDVNSLAKRTAALDLAGVEIVHEGAPSKANGCGVRLKSCHHEAATAGGGDQLAIRSFRAERADK
jgi:hypothetical protein